MYLFYDLCEFFSSARVSLPSSQCSSSSSSSLQRNPPTRSRTDSLQHIQGGCTTSSHSSVWRVSYLFYLFLFLFNVFIFQNSLHLLFISLVECLFLFHSNGKPGIAVLRASKAVHACFALQRKPIPLRPQHADLTNRHAPRRAFHGVMENDCQLGLGLWCDGVKCQNEMLSTILSVHQLTKMK